MAKVRCRSLAYAGTIQADAFSSPPLQILISDLASRLFMVRRSRSLVLSNALQLIRLLFTEQGRLLASRTGVLSIVGPRVACCRDGSHVVAELSNPGCVRAERLLLRQ